MSATIFNRTFTPDGRLIRSENVDLENDTLTVEVEGVVVEIRPLTEVERAQYGPQPLDQAGALATLLAVLELSTVKDAANAVGLTEQDLVDEAEAWQAMKGTP